MTITAPVALFVSGKNGVSVGMSWPALPSAPGAPSGQSSMVSFGCARASDVNRMNGNNWIKIFMCCAIIPDGKKVSPIFVIAREAFFRSRQSLGARQPAGRRGIILAGSGQDTNNPAKINRCANIYLHCCWRLD